MCSFRILAVSSFLPGTKRFFHGFSLFWVLVELEIYVDLETSYVHVDLDLPYLLVHVGTCT